MADFGAKICTATVFTRPRRPPNSPRATHTAVAAPLAPRVARRGFLANHREWFAGGSALPAFEFVSTRRCAPEATATQRENFLAPRIDNRTQFVIVYACILREPAGRSFDGSSRSPAPQGSSRALVRCGPLHASAFASLLDRTLPMIRFVGRARAPLHDASNGSSRRAKTFFCSRSPRLAMRFVSSRAGALQLQSARRDHCESFAFHRFRRSTYRDAKREMRSSTRAPISSRNICCRRFCSRFQCALACQRCARYRAADKQTQLAARTNNESDGRRHLGDALSAARDVIVRCRDVAHDFDILNGLCLYLKPASAYTSQQRSLRERIRDCRAFFCVSRRDMRCKLLRCASEPAFEEVQAEHRAANRSRPARAFPPCARGGFTPSRVRTLAACRKRLP